MTISMFDENVEEIFFFAPIQPKRTTRLSVFPLFMEFSEGKRVASLNWFSHLQLLDEMMDDKGVTKAFLFTNLAILLNAKAMAWRFWRTFCTELLNDSQLNINWRHRTSRSPLSRFSLFSRYILDHLCTDTALFTRTPRSAGMKTFFFALLILIPIPKKVLSRAGL